MKRSIARCKRCGTEFVMHGELSGCVNCGHGELECFPEDFDDIAEPYEDIPTEELVALAEDIAKMDEDDFMTDLMKENQLTQKFLEDLDRELDEIELPEKHEGGETPYEKGERLRKASLHGKLVSWLGTDFYQRMKENAKKGQSPLREGSAFTKANGFELDDCISCTNDCTGCEKEAELMEAIDDAKERTWTNPAAVKKIVKGRCRSCAYWNKLAPQAGSCKYLEHKPGVNVKMWYDTCLKYIRSLNYDAQQVETRERRKAHESILRAMERSRT